MVEYQGTLKIQPTTLTDLTVTRSQYGEVKNTLSLSDFTVQNDYLESNINFRVGDEVTISSTGYQTQTLTVSAPFSNVIVLAPLEFSNIETNSIKYYCKDETARNSITDINTTLDGKVSKAGDTMTGALTVETAGTVGNETCRYILKNTEMENNVAPSINLVSSFSFVDKNNTQVGSCYYRRRTDNVCDIRLIAKSFDGTDQATLAVGFNSSGDAYCSFPNTECVDGQWVYKNTSLGSGVTWNASSHSSAKGYSLSSYLPNDGQNYEVIVRAQGTTTSTSGKYISIGIYSDIITTQIYACSCRTRSSSTVNCSGNVVIPVGTGRKIYVNGCGSEASADGTYNIACIGYRRIGTNS